MEDGCNWGLILYGKEEHSYAYMLGRRLRKNPSGTTISRNCQLKVDGGDVAYI